MTMFLTRLFSILTLLVLAACGGGGGSGGTSPLGSGSGSGTGGSSGSGGATSVPTTIKLELSSTEVSSASPANLTATVTDSTGAAVGNAVVAFSLVRGGLATLTQATVLTNAQGIATSRLNSSLPATSGADEVLATVSAGTTNLTSRLGFSVKAEAPEVRYISLSSSSVNSTTPATYRVQVLGPTKAPQANAIVNFSSASNLVSFTPSSQLTDSNGIASVVVTPRNATSNGADILRATALVSGVSASSEQVVQVTTAVPTGTPTLELVLSSPSISAASPATVTATLRDAQGQGVAGQVVTFSVARGLAVTNIVTALTQAAPNLGKAVVVLSPSNSSAAGADDVTASVTYAGVQVSRSQGFQVQATPVSLTSLDAGVSTLSAYGQTTLTLGLSGASVTSPVSITMSSSCVSQGKATLSPSSFTATTNTVTMQYRDNGCGAVQATDQLQAVVTSSGLSRTLSLPIATPAESSIAFRSASPEQIFLRGSGFTETSVVTFEVRDAAGNPLPNRVVELRLQTGAGGVTMEGRGVESVNPPSDNPFTLTSNALGQVAVRVNSGTLPSPIRVNARLQASPSIATVSSNLSVAVGLPSQLNFSMSQGTRNIEGYNIDGTPNTYSIIAADRSGNPVPAGTSINFVAEGGQIEAVKQTQLVQGIARTTAGFVSAEPRPVDGRVTITAYALGEESFLDQNGDNAYTLGEPFQDLGNIFKDRNFDGVFDPQVDEFVSLRINNASECANPGSDLLLLDASIPSVGGSCDGRWSGAGQVYVRRALETVLSTSAARPLWATTRGLDSSCVKIDMQVGPNPTQIGQFTLVAGDTYYGGTSDSLNFIVADANPGSSVQGRLPRLNPMAAGTRLSATTPTPGLAVTVGGGSPVPSTTEASLASIAYSFTPPASSGIIFVTFTSPSGTGTTVGVNVVAGTRPSVCP